MQAILALEDGRIFRGKGYGAKAECYGEVVFNTSITGYQEIFTDPSYAGQIVVLTNPEIGNYGTNPEDNEATRPFIEGLVVREFSPISSNWRSQQVADEYLERYKIPVIAEVDTRAIVRHLRQNGIMRGVISSCIRVDGGENFGKEVVALGDINHDNLADFAIAHQRCDTLADSLSLFPEEVYVYHGVKSGLPDRFDGYLTGSVAQSVNLADGLRGSVINGLGASMVIMGLICVVLFRSLRLALTGRDRGPELWAVIAALPADELLRRIDAAEQ